MEGVKRVLFEVLGKYMLWINWGIGVDRGCDML